MISLARPWRSMAGTTEHSCSSQRRSPTRAFELQTRCAQATKRAFSTKIYRGLHQTLASSASGQSTCSVKWRLWARLPQEAVSARDRLSYLQRYTAPHFWPDSAQTELQIEPTQAPNAGSDRSVSLTIKWGKATMRRDTNLASVSACLRRQMTLWPSGQGVGLLSRWGLPAWARIPQVSLFRLLCGSWRIWNHRWTVLAM